MYAFISYDTVHIPFDRFSFTGFINLAIAINFGLVGLFYYVYHRWYCFLTLLGQSFDFQLSHFYFTIVRTTPPLVPPLLTLAQC